MHKLKELCKLIREELDGAEHYIDLAILYKEESREMADTFSNLSAQEVGHVEKLTSLAADQISHIKQDGGSCSEGIPWIWSWEYEKAAERLATIRVKQEIYRK